LFEPGAQDLIAADERLQRRIQARTVKPAFNQRDRMAFQCVIRNALLQRPQLFLLW
jgi:hypothetical protein